MCRVAKGSLSGRSILVLIRVKSVKEMATSTEIAKRISINTFAMPPFTSSAYSEEARASTVSGNE